MSKQEQPTQKEFFSHDRINVIEPKKGWQSLNLRELWAYRELLLVLSQRDIKVRYKQTVLGITWAVIQPLMTMVLFSIVFGRLAKCHPMACLTPYLFMPACCPGPFSRHR